MEYDVGFDFKEFIILSGEWYKCKELENKVENYYNEKRYFEF